MEDLFLHLWAVHDTPSFWNGPLAADAKLVKETVPGLPKDY